MPGCWSHEKILCRFFLRQRDLSDAWLIFESTFTKTSPPCFPQDCRFCGRFERPKNNPPGIPILRCAELAPQACGNLAMANLFEGGYAAAKSGATISYGFSRTLPPEFLELWAIGEEPGNPDKIAEKLSQIYPDKVQFRFDLIAQ